LNGRVAQQGNIKQFFHSVSRNVDNPHFLVMQGTVHKLLNMKPSEVLGWIEEAAGTRMFDARKRVAEHLIAGKERKLEELNKTIDEEISPMLVNIGNEQSEYDQYLRISSSLDLQQKFGTAYQFWRNLHLVESSANTVMQYRNEIENANRELRTLPSARDRLKEELRAVEVQRAASNKIDPLQEKNREQKKLLVALKAQLTTIEKSKSKTAENIKMIETAIQKNQQKTKDFSVEVEEFRSLYNKLQTEKAELENRIENLKKSLQLLKSGLQVGDKGVTLTEEKELVDKELAAIRMQLSRLTTESEKIVEEMSTLEKKLASGSGDKDKLLKDIAKAEQDAQESERVYKAQTRGCDPETVAKMEASLNELRAKREKVLNEGAANFAFDYNQVPGVDLARAIYGRVGELVTVKKKDLSLALSTAAGANLLKVVIKDDDTAQILIEKANLKQRTTFFPLNKVQHGHIDKTRQEAAAQSASSHGGWAQLALHLVEYAEPYAAVMDKVFGQFFVCSDIAVAKAVAFGPAKSRAITVQGDVVDPSGIMQGGSSTGLRDYLAELQACRSSKNAYAEIMTEFNRVTSALQDAKAKMNAGSAQRMQWEQASTIATALKRQFENQSMSATTIASKKAELAQRQIDIKQNQEGAQQKEKELAHRCTEINAKLSKGTVDAKADEREFQTKMKEAQQRLVKVNEELNKGQSRFDDSESKKNELEQRTEDLMLSKQDYEKELQQSTVDDAAKRSEIQRMSDDISAVDHELGKEQERVRNVELQCSNLASQLESNQERENALAKIVRDREAEIKNMGRHVEESKKENQELERTHMWISQEKSTFGDAAGPYYFNDRARTEEGLHQLAESRKMHEAMSKKVNKKATIVLEGARKEYEDLVRRRDQLLNDKKIILRTIAQVEDKKWKSLDIMVEKVSRGFSVLFATCLPGATCRLLEMREEHGRLCGLEVRVAFHGKEKESLSELSGGQRSLLALCLILAILKFRPAPVYILDEVDAALDPSHTQNIGKMLQTHFHDAQFLLVSLKDGMFGNANVIYEVRNTQGYSEVVRRTNH
jgi:structural maintenance of chromosome 2